MPVNLKWQIFIRPVCPLAKSYAQRVKQETGRKEMKGCVFQEEPIKPVEDMAISCRSNCICPPGAKHKCTERRAILEVWPCAIGIRTDHCRGSGCKDLVKDC